MDLSFRFDRDSAGHLPVGPGWTVTALPTRLAVLMVGVAARQAASPTAMIQGALPVGAPERPLLAPVHGAFNRAVETALMHWKEQ